MKTKKHKSYTLALAGLGMIAATQSASAVVLTNVDGGGTAFFTSVTNTVYNQAAVIIGGSAAATIPEFITLAFFDVSSAGLVGGESLSGGTLTIAINGAGTGDHQGNVQAEFVGTIGVVPNQNAANGSADVNELIDLAFNDPATEVFNDAIAVGANDTADVTSVVNGVTSGFLVFRFSDTAPAPAADEQSGVVASLDVSVIPEPSSSILILGGAGLALLRRRA